MAGWRVTSQRPPPRLVSPLTLSAFATGVGGYLLQSHLPPAWLVFGLSASVSALTYRWRWLLPLTAALWGFHYTDVTTGQFLRQPLAPALIGQDIQLTGRIANLPDVSANSTRFAFAPDSARVAGRAVTIPPRLSLNWYNTRTSAVPPLAAGSRWQLTVRLKPPHGALNRGGFDVERWFLIEQYGATGSVRAAPAPQLLDADAGSYWLTRWRQLVAQHLDAVLGAPSISALLRALVIGDVTGMTPAQWQIFNRTGTIHLIAISGGHITLIAGSVFAFIRWLWARSAHLSTFIAAPRAAAYASFIAGCSYSAFAGFAVATQRAALMLIVVFMAVISGRVTTVWHGFLLALVGVLLINPALLLSFGLWLSFGAVALLIYATSGRLMTQSNHWTSLRRHPWRVLYLLVWTQWVITLGLLPLAAALFGYQSVISFAANLVAVPLFSILLPLLLLATGSSVLLHWSLPLVWLAQGTGYLEQGLAQLAASPWAIVAFCEQPLWVWLAAMVGMLLLTAPRGVFGRWLGCIWLLPLVCIHPAAPVPGQMQLTVLDVGQGLSAIIRTATHTLIYDLGPAQPHGFNSGERIVAPALYALGIRHVDLLMISHADNDHAGGLSGLLAAPIAIEHIVSGEPQRLTGVTAERCQRGQRWQWDGVQFTVLHPTAAAFDNANDHSCVLQVRVGTTALLLTGDISAAVERQLVHTDGAALHSTILIASHHGSAQSSSLPFLQQVAPQWVIYSAGYLNRYHFPAQRVITRVQQVGSASLNTATTGAIELVFTATGVAPPQLARHQQQRVWRHVITPPRPAE